MIKSIFLKDPTQTVLANKGVAKVAEDRAKTVTLRAELESFVCQGEYEAGLSNILQAFLRNHASNTEQAGVWISGFFGSGKSHLAKMLRHLWTNEKFTDGASPRGVANLPQVLIDEFKELDVAGKRSGGLHAAAGTLDSAANSNVRMAVMGIVFRSLDLPEAWHQASFVQYLREDGLEEQLQARLSDEWVSELGDLYVGKIAIELLKLKPDLGGSVADVRKLLREQFPQKSDISSQELVDMVGRVLRHRFHKKMPLTVLVLDEVQQFIGADPQRAMMVQETIESLSTRFNDKLLVVATGQAALRETPSLQKLMGRFPVGVQLSETDVDAVLRKVLLAKKPEELPKVTEITTKSQGELAHQLQDTAVGWRPTDRDLVAQDYPLVPSRRRFWDAVLRGVDLTGTGAQLRSQLHTVHETLNACAEEELGYIVPGDALYDHLAANLLITSVLPRITYEEIQRLNSGDDGERLQARILKLVFLLQQIPDGASYGRGLDATEPVLLDLLISRMDGERQELSQRLKKSLEAMLKANRLQKLPSGVFALQTPEGLGWSNEFDRQKGEFGQNPSWQDAEIRTRLQEEWPGVAGKVATVQHGECQEPRSVRLSFDLQRPQGRDLAIWVRTSRETSWEAFEAEARSAGTECPVSFVYVPMTGDDRLVQHLLVHKAAQRVLEIRGASQSREAQDARAAMEARSKDAAGMARAMLKDDLYRARVLMGGGTELSGGFLKEKIVDSLKNSLPVLYPQFDVADHPSWGKVWERANKGQPDALSQVQYSGEPEAHPVCRQILLFVGVHGKQGKEVREHFSNGQFGWPQDAIDGALAVLAVAGKIKVLDAGRSPVAAGGWDRKAIPSFLFQSEQVSLKTDEKLRLKGLLQRWTGKIPQAGQEETALREWLLKLQDLASQAGGAAPAPTASYSETLEQLRIEGGNSLLKAALDAADELTATEARWKTLGELLKERKLRWALLQELLQAGHSLMPLGTVRSQADAILQNRSLLTEPDPVSPLLELAVDQLRKVLAGHWARLQALRDSEEASLQASPEWQKLSVSDQRSLTESVGLLRLQEPELGTADDVAQALRERSLTGWKDLEEAFPVKFAKLRELAILKLQPQAKSVSLPKRTVQSEAELDQWWLEVRAQVLESLKSGPVIL